MPIAEADKVRAILTRFTRETIPDYIIENSTAILEAGGVQKLDASDIYYVEICDHDLLFHTKQGEVHSTGSMRDVEQKLPPENFFRSSKAYLVNLEHVDGIQDEDAIVNGDRVQISRAKRKAFLAALNHYMGEPI